MTLRLNQTMTSDPNTILSAWGQHIKSVGACSNEDHSFVLSEQVDWLLINSKDNEDFVLDVPFCIEEVECAIRKLKCGKSAGYDHEHIRVWWHSP